jgi:hypothetical protein
MNIRADTGRHNVLVLLKSIPQARIRDSRVLTNILVDDGLYSVLVGDTSNRKNGGCTGVHNKAPKVKVKATATANRSESYSSL